MLVLTRKPGESLVIGNTITVQVVEVRGDQVRIGIDAPREIRVLREEVHREVVRANAQAASEAARTQALLARRGGTRPADRPRRPPQGE